jgi:predicted HTH domain antitoxin
MPAHVTKHWTAAACDRPSVMPCTGEIRAGGRLPDTLGTSVRERFSKLAYTDSVRIWLDLPDNAVRQLADEGQDLSKVALEALAIDAYRTSRITAHQLCELLDMPSRYELDGFLKQHGVPLEYSLEDFDREAATSARLWEKREAERAAESDRQRRA